MLEQWHCQVYDGSKFGHGLDIVTLVESSFACPECHQGPKSCDFVNIRDELGRDRPAIFTLRHPPPMLGSGNQNSISGAL